MPRCGYWRVALWLLTFVLGPPWVVDAQGPLGSVLHLEEACAEFRSGGNVLSGWQYSDCVDVWTSWVGVLPRYVYGPFTERHLLLEVAAQMRQRGLPCLVQSGAYHDGVGSSTMRYLASWMFAEEIGCDWITPHWNKKSVDGAGTGLYCHGMYTIAELEQIRVGNAVRDPNKSRCMLHNWMAYFGFDSHSVALPTNGSLKVVEAQPAGPVQLQEALNELKLSGFDQRPWDHLLITLDLGSASRYVEAVRSWDDFKRQKIRQVLQAFRKNFHSFSRPSFDQAPECAYGSAQLDFAIHVRLGDRAKLMPGGHDDYIRLLEAFIDTITKRVVDKTQTEPAFHVFSETSLPCPSSQNGTFGEFPSWQVEIDQVLPCLEVGTPTDCPEKQYGAPCHAERSGVFRVQGRPLYLHVGFDVENALSCMIKADGLLMGCSTFGHIAGVLNDKGISFFSTECDGAWAPVHYKMIPPLAVAEGGHMWVPISGSWRNPVLTSFSIFEVALDNLLTSKGIS